MLCTNDREIFLYVSRFLHCHYLKDENINQKVLEYMAMQLQCKTNLQYIPQAINEMNVTHSLKTDMDKLELKYI